MNTITDHDIRDHFVIPALEPAPDECYDVPAIMADLLAAYPLSGWTYADLRYSHPAYEPDVFWEIVSSHAR